MAKIFIYLPRVGDIFHHLLWEFLEVVSRQHGSQVSYFITRHQTWISSYHFGHKAHFRANNCVKETEKKRMQNFGSPPPPLTLSQALTVQHPVLPVYSCLAIAPTTPQNTGPLVILMETSLGNRKATMGKYKVRCLQSGTRSATVQVQKTSFRAQNGKGWRLLLVSSTSRVRSTEYQGNNQKEQNGPSTPGVLAGE